MRSLLWLVLILPLLVGCESVGASAATDRKLVETDWHAVAVGTIQVPDPSRVTLSISAERVGGRSACNQYSGPVEFGGGRIKVGLLISTKMACVNDGTMQLEQAYLETLRTAHSYAIDSEGRLTITTQSGHIVYVPAPRNQRP